MDEDAEDRGLLGEYGVVIVPPSDHTNQWFVTLAAWDDESQAYVAGTDGPIRETKEEALEEVGKVMDWLAAQPPDSDLTKLWEQMQQDIGPPEVQQPRHGWPWTR
jgi:hypothetical protein